METAPPFLFLLYIAPRLPPALSALSSVQGPSPSAVSDPFPTAAQNPSSQPLPQDCSRAPGFLSYHSVCFHGVTIQISSIIIKINKDFFLQTRMAFSDLAVPGTEVAGQGWGKALKDGGLGPSPGRGRW